MTKTPKAYRDDLTEDLYWERKAAQEKIKRIQDNPDFLEGHKHEAIKKTQEQLYQKLDYVRSTPEYQDAKSKKQALRGKKKDVKKQEDIVAEQKKLLGDKEAELATMSEEYGEKFEKKSEKKESKEITKEHLLNKPNMTVKDKEWMQKSIDYLVEKKMDTSENLQKLDAIVYTSESIEIWGVKRARKDITAKPNGKNIFQHNNVTYFKRSEDMIKEQNDLLAKQGMEIPLDSFYEKSMKALPGNYSKSNRYEWWNILALITNMSMDGYCDSDGRLHNKDTYGYRRSASSYDKDPARYFSFNKDKGTLSRNDRGGALPVRPVLK